MKDAEVQKLVTYVKAAQTTHDNALAAMQAARSTAKPAVKEKQDLITALTTEITARKKETIKSKSLPDMEKLLIAVKGLNTNECQAKSPTKDFMGYIPEEINKSKGVAAEEEENEMEEQRLNERVVTINRSKVASRLKELNNSVTLAIEAEKAKKASDMQTHKAAAKVAAEEINKTVTEYANLAAK
ncbi:MAG TPA: hypothetical protein VGN88_04805, partial [Phycisphaerae bacterium]